MKFFYCIKTSKQELITIASTLLTAVGLLGIKWTELTLIKKISIYIALSLALLLIIYSIFKIFCGKHIYKLKKDEDKIVKYMQEIYLHSGSLFICTTGKLDWVNQEIKNELLSKAKTKHLIIFSSTKNSFLNELEKSGAIIYDKSTLGMIPCSNTSILNANGRDIFIATGHTDNKYHVIDEYTVKSSITNVINDLINIIEKLISQNCNLKRKLLKKQN